MKRVQAVGNKLNVTLKGVNFGVFVYSPDGTTWGYQFTTQDLINARKWGCNCIRLPFQQDYWENVPAYKQMEIDFIDYAETLGMYTMLDNHWTNSTDRFSLGRPSDWNAWVDMWRNIATLFQGRTNLIYEVWNEPHTIPPSEWQQWVETCIDAIREIEPNAMIVVDGMDWGSTFYFVESNPILRDNICYAGHHYVQYDPNDGTVDGIRAMLVERRWYYVLENLEKPLICNEFGAFNAAQADGWMRNFLWLMKNEMDIGYIAWDWHTQPDEPALLQYWDGTPNYAGIVLQEYLPTPTPNLMSLIKGITRYAGPVAAGTIMARDALFKRRG